MSELDIPTGENVIREAEARQALLFSREFFTSPYPTYDRLRTERPVYWSEETQRWLLTRYEDVARALRTREFITHPQRAGLFRLWFPYMDHDDHARVRRMLKPYFRTARIKDMTAQIGAVADPLLDAFLAKPAGDFMTEVADHLPVRLVTRLLGLPMEDSALFLQWAEDITAAKGIAVSLERKFKAVEHFQAMHRYMQAFVRDVPEDADHLTAELIRANKAGELKEEEVPITVMLLVVASVETTSSMLGNALLALLQHPDQGEKLAQRPALVANAVEEILRYETPVQFINRIAQEDTEFAGVRIRKNDHILALIGAANRDPEQFPEPNRLDIERKNAVLHLSFGGGVHHCTGTPLAREIAAVVIGRLVPELSRMRLAREVEDWQSESLMFRRLKSLPIEIAAR